jgi:hypothetical protein
MAVREYLIDGRWWSPRELAALWGVHIGTARHRANAAGRYRYRTKVAK